MLAARCRPAIDHRLIATGQHGAMFHETLAAFGAAADGDLGVMIPGQSPDELAAAIEPAVRAAIERLRPDMLLVQGDTTSAWAAARAAFSAGVPIGHVEAGLRSGDLTSPWPEERNRVEIDALADLLFAPTRIAAAHLAAERAVRGHVALTGNTGIDALLAMRARLEPAHITDGRRLILVTTHRRENIGAGITGICTALEALARRGDVSIALPVHPNPAVAAQVRDRLGGREGITLLPPLDYPDMVLLMTLAHLILSDSGGLQEEAPALGVPILVLRENSERPESIACGGARLVGTDPATIVAAASRLLDDPATHAAMACPAFPYGKGDAAGLILDTVIAWHEGRLPRGFRPARPRATLAIASPLAQGGAAKGRT